MRWLRFMLAAGLAAQGAAAAAAPLVETPQFHAFGTADGLPSETVYVLAQDREGYLWIGTGDGLARYDGVEFVIYRHRPEAADSLPSNVIQALHVDGEGRVWVGTEGGGLSRLEPGGGFRHWRRGAPAGLELDDVWSIASTPDGAIWFGGYAGGLYRLDPADGTLHGYRHDPADPRSPGSDHVLALAVDRDGTLWIGGGAGVDRFDGTAFVRHPPGDGGPRGALIFSLTADADGGLWIGSAAGLDHRSADGRIRPAAQGEHLSEPGVTALLRDGPGSLWLATRSGLHHWQDGSLRHYPTPSPRQAGSGRSSLLDLLRDHEGGLWFASVGGGLLYLPPNWRDFTVLRARRDDPATLSAVTPRGIAAADDGTLWVVGRDGGLDRVDPRNGRVQRRLDRPDALPDRRLHAVLQGGDGAVWIGHQLGISRYQPADGVLRHWLAGDGDDAPPAGAVDLLIADGSGGLWLSAYSGGVERRAADGRVLARHLPGPAGDLPSADIEQLALGPDGALWLAGSFGIARRDHDGRIQVLAGAPAQRVHSFDFAGSGTLWSHRLGALERFAYDGSGLRLLEQVTGSDGLPPVESGGLRIDRTGAVWLTSRRGLLRYRPNTREFRGFGVRDGLGNQEFSDRPALRLADGSIAAGTLDGLVLFDPTALYEPAQPPDLRLHRISVLRDGQRIEFAHDAPIALRHDDRELQVAARRVSFAPVATPRWRFRLDGFDDDWIETGGSGERTFSRLPPGAYRLQIDDGSADAVATRGPLALQLQVHPPGWQTLPARVAQLFALLVLLAAAWRAQRRRVAHRHAAELAERQRQWALQALEARSQFLATLGHEIRTPMTGVLGMTELLLRGGLDPPQRARAEAIRRSGELMLRLLNDALDLARIEAGRLPLDERVFDLQACVAELGAQQQALAAARGLAFATELDPAVARWRRGDPMRLQQVLLNLTGNAIKFTERGGVTLRLLGLAGSAFELQVADSGPGLDREQCARLFRRFEQGDGARTVRSHGGSGLGLAISRELVVAMGGRIEVDSTPGVGSCFRVRLDLPLADPVDAAPAPALPARAGAGRRVLLVEDDATIAEVLQSLLAAHGWQVVHVAHGLAALGEVAATAFDAAVLDLDLPGLDGMALARLLRPQHPGLPMLALTARADPRAEPEALAAGFDRFLRKPVDGATLSAALSALVGRGAAATLVE